MPPKMPKILNTPQEIMAHLKECHDATPPDRWLFCVHPARKEDGARLSATLAALHVPAGRLVYGKALVEVVGLPPEVFSCWSIPRADLPAYLLAAVHRWLTGAVFTAEEIEQQLAFVFVPEGEAWAFMQAVLDASLNPGDVAYHATRPDPLTN